MLTGAGAGGGWLSDLLLGMSAKEAEEESVITRDYRSPDFDTEVSKVKARLEAQRKRDRSWARGGSADDKKRSRGCGICRRIIKSTLGIVINVFRIVKK